MSKKVYDEKIDINVDWGGDASTGNLPVSGGRVQEVIKETLNSKVGHVGMVESTGMYVLTKDEDTYNTYLETITTDNPKGDQDLLIGEFRAPFEYSASVEILTPAEGYAVILEGTTGNVLKFRPSTKDSSGAPVSETYSYTITFRNGGVTQTYNGRVSKDSTVEINIDKYLSKGTNAISIMVTGQDTGVSAFKSAEIRILEISLVDSFDISSVYNLRDNNSQLTVNYKVKSTGPTKIKWYIDNNLVDETVGSNFNTENGVKNIMLQKGAYSQGVHSLRFYMECQDTTSNDTFRTDIFHREFFVMTGEDQTAPMIAMSFDMPYDATIIADKKAPNVFDAVQYENVDLKFSVYYQGKANTPIDIEVLRPNTADYEIDSSYLTKNGDVYNHELSLKDEGSTTIRIVANNVQYNVGPFFVQKSDMNISAVENNVTLYFNAQGKTNSSSNKDDWRYTDLEGKEYKVKFNNFAWSPTNGWNNDKLVIARGSSIDIDFAPFEDPARLAAGVTFEFEFNTINVYDDDAVICNLCDDSGAPGILITATEAKLIVNKGTSGPESDTAASTKFKSGENNRISFVITPRGEQSNRGRFVKVYVNGVICGAVVYDYNAQLTNNKKLHFEATDGAEIELVSIRFYSSALSNDEILDNYIFFRSDVNERIELYKKNNIYDENNVIDIDAIKQQIPVMLFKQRLKSDGSGETEGKIEDIETEYVDKKKTVHFDIEYENLQDPTLNFKVERARVTPQGTSSMKYPKKNFRFYTAKEDDTVLYDYEGNVVPKRKYSFKHGSAAVKCWCLKADFAESSGTHNTGTARFWNNVLKEAGLLTKAQAKAKATNYKYDVRTTVDGFPIVLFYQEVGSTPRFIGKYNFNNDKSTEDVFGFTGGSEVEGQEYKYFLIGKERPIIQSEVDEETGVVEYACTFEEGGYTDTPNEDSPLYVSDNEGNWYMLRGKELFDNPRMECWEMLDSGALIGLFKTVEGFSVERKKKEAVGRYYNKVNDDGTVTETWEEAFESRYPDCGDYYHTNNLKALCDWLVSCIYLKIDDNGKAVNMTDEELMEATGESTLTIHSITKYNGNDVYYQWDTNNNCYKKLSSTPTDSTTANTKSIIEVPSIKDGDNNIVYLIIKFSTYYNPVTLSNTAENRKEKFRVEKYDHFDMEKMAAYYIYLLRFGGVDQVVKNAMLTTEGSDDNEGHPEWPSKWFYINYDNDTILGVKNNGHLVFDPYITRETKEAGGAFAYAGRESTMWNNLEGDAEFMSLVSTVDEKLHTLNGLSYNNAIDMYNNKQAGQWCERVYNMDAQYKYIDSYVSPTVSETSGSADMDYLFDVQGPRSAHRKWWLSKRFNILDSKFVTGDFLKSDIVLKVNDLKGDRNVVLTSGEDIYYAIGGNDSVYYITSDAVLSGNDCLLPIYNGTQIGTPISIYGGPNIEKLDLRGISDSLVQLELANAYNANLGSKLKKLYIGDKNNPLINSFGDWTTSGFGNLEKCEEMDFTGMSSQSTINDLIKLKNLKKLYASGTKMQGMEFAEGGMIEDIEAPSGIQTLIFKQLPNMTFDALKIYNIRKEGEVITKTLNETYGDLMSLTIHECPKMMNRPEFILNWLNKKKSEGKALSSFTLDMDGVDWTFNDVNSLSILSEVGTGTGKLNLAGKIHINKILSPNEVALLQSIFGKNCFEIDAQLRVTAYSSVYIVGDDNITEGDGVHKYDFIRVNLDSEGTFTVSLKDNMGSLPDESYVKFINNTTGCTIEVLENNSDTIQLVLALKYEYGIEVANENKVITISNRIYPSSVTITGKNDNLGIGETGLYEYELLMSSNMGEVNGVMEYEWELTGDATELNGSRPYLEIKSIEGNKCTLILNSYYDGTARLAVNVYRKYDHYLLFSTKQAYKDLFIADPSTLFTPNRNAEIYNILLNAGLVPQGREKVTKGDAMLYTINQLVPNGVSIFKGHHEIKTFDEFMYFTNISEVSNSMFEGCSGMTSITLPAGTLTIGNNAFSNCRVLTGIICNSAIVVGDNAFSNCSALSTAVFSDRLTTIGTSAFSYCGKLGEFHVSSSLTNLKYTETANAFQRCGEIYFKGGNETFKVDNGNLYHIVGDTINLVHMGKGCLMSSLMTGVTINALPYSMEYRTEKNLVIPNNIKFNGTYVLSNSKGNSVTLTTSTVGMKTDYLFNGCDFGNNYIFASNETVIPTGCFNGTPNLTSFVVPEGIKTIESSAFYSCTNLKEITLPTTLENIGINAFWIASMLTKVYFKGSVPPKMSENDFFGVGLEAIYVYPEYIDTYRNNIIERCKLFVTPWYLYDEGYVRIIKDGQIMFYANVGDVVNNVTIGGVKPVQMSDGYLKYNMEGNRNSDLTVKVNGSIAGSILQKYTTLYIGDNTSLFTGDGVNFTKGIFNEMTNGLWPNGNVDGWYYDPKCEGLRSSKPKQNTTSLTFFMNTYKDKNISILFTNMVHDDNIIQILGSNGNVLLTIDEEINIDVTKTFTVPNDGIFTVKVTKTKSTVIGIDGIVIKTIGNSVYSDPEVQIMTLSDDAPVMSLINVTLNGVVSPMGAIVNVSDGQTTEFNKVYNGELLQFIVPANKNYTVTPMSFVNEKGKYFHTTGNQLITNANGIYDLSFDYTIDTGVYVNGDILIYKTIDTDYYIYLNKYEGVWSENNSVISEVEVDDIFIADTNGFVNTEKVLLHESDNNMFRTAYTTKVFGETVKGYIPSYIEMSIIMGNISTINNVLKLHGKDTLDLTNCWVSDSYDKNNAWTSDGKIESKDILKHFFIFGKRIIK